MDPRRKRKIEKRVEKARRSCKRSAQKFASVHARLKAAMDHHSFIISEVKRLAALRELLDRMPMPVRRSAAEHGFSPTIQVIPPKAAASYVITDDATASNSTSTASW